MSKKQTRGVRTPKTGAKKKSAANSRPAQKGQTGNSAPGGSRGRQKAAHKSGGAHAAGGKRAPLFVSQNFLTARSTIGRIVGLANLGPDDHVVEIGPGKGHITAALLRRCGRVSAVELDSHLHAKLAQRFAGEEKLALHRADFLVWPLPKEPYKVFANIPFSRTSEIVRKLAHGPQPQEMWLVMEKGAAKRLMGRPGESTASLLLKPFYDLELSYHFRREDFHPAPAVDVVQLHFKRKAKPDIAPGQRKAYERFVRAGLRSGMQGLCTKKQIGRALREAGLPAEFVPHTALYVQWLCLFRCYWQHSLGRPL